MTSEMATVLWICAVGAAVLFAAFAALVGLIYLLTTPWPIPKLRSTVKPRRGRLGASESPASDANERERRRRAAALAAAIASADGVRRALESPEGISAWTLVHRSRWIACPAPPRTLRW
jgi:hypothetical protein